MGTRSDLYTYKDATISCNIRTNSVNSRVLFRFEIYVAFLLRQLVHCMKQNWNKYTWNFRGRATEHLSIPQNYYKSERYRFYVTDFQRLLPSPRRNWRKTGLLSYSCIACHDVTSLTPTTPFKKCKWYGIVSPLEMSSHYESIRGIRSWSGYHTARYHRNGGASWSADRSKNSRALVCRQRWWSAHWSASRVFFLRVRVAVFLFFLLDSVCEGDDWP